MCISLRRARDETSLSSFHSGSLACASMTAIDCVAIRRKTKVYGYGSVDCFNNQLMRPRHARLRPRASAELEAGVACSRANSNFFLKKSMTLCSYNIPEMGRSCRFQLSLCITEHTHVRLPLRLFGIVIYKIRFHEQ